jgi:hypothetical protein
MIFCMGIEGRVLEGWWGKEGNFFAFEAYFN